MKDQIGRISSLCLFFMIITLPITFLPNQYTIPILGKSLPAIFLMLSIGGWGLLAMKNHDFSLPYKRFWVSFIIWPIICLIIGAITFPFYSPEISNMLATMGVMKKLIAFLSIHNNILPYILYFKLFLSELWYLFRDFYFPLLGIFFCIYSLFKWQNKNGE